MDTALHVLWGIGFGCFIVVAVVYIAKGICLSADWWEDQIHGDE